METDDIMKAGEPAVAYGTNSYADVMMMLYTMPITREVKRHVGLRLVAETAADSNIAKAFDRLDHLATLGGNWDGEGALPISRQVINNLKRVLLISDDADWKDWQIGPDTNATLGLQSANTDACISIGTEEYSYYADINGKEHHASRVKFTPKSFLDVMRRIG